MRLVLVALIVVIAGAFAMVAWQITHPAGPAAPSAPVAIAPTAAPLPARFLTAAQGLSPGTLIRDSDIAVKAVPREQLSPDAILDDDEGRASVTGALVQRFVEPGAMITRADLLRNRDRGFLAAVLAPGTRAVSIGVDPITGVSGLIWPGDHVDVILTQELDHPSAGGKRIIGETVLTNIRVIAIDQDIVQGAPRGSNVAGKLATTVTVQANADEAERLAVVTRLGRLSLAIRSFADSMPTTDNKPRQVTAVSGDDVSPARSAAEGAGRTKVLVIQGDQRSEVTFR